MFTPWAISHGSPFLPWKTTLLVSMMVKLGQNTYYAYITIGFYQYLKTFLDILQFSLGLFQLLLKQT